MHDNNDWHLLDLQNGQTLSLVDTPQPYSLIAPTQPLNYYFNYGSQVEPDELEFLDRPGEELIGGLVMGYDSFNQFALSADGRSRRVSLARYGRRPQLWARRFGVARLTRNCGSADRGKICVQFLLGGARLAHFSIRSSCLAPVHAYPNIWPHPDT
jgi:hypothetical protein